MTALLAITLLAGAPAVEAARAALEAEPKRPGLRLALAHGLLKAGQVDEAEQEAQAVLAQWPESLRPHLVLAGVAFARGDLEGARGALSLVAERAPAPLAAAARASLERLGRGPASPWSLRGVMGAAYDTRAAPPEVGLDEDDGEAATRLRLGVGADWKRTAGPWRGDFGFGVDRTLHLGGAEERDRLLALAQGRLVRDLPAGLVGARLEARGALTEAVTPHHGGGGLGMWYGRGVSPFSPFVEVRGLYFRFAEQGDAWVGDAGLGATTHLKRWRGTLRLGALRVLAGSGFAEYGADLGGDVLLGAMVLSAKGGLGLREGFSDLRPRAHLGLRWRLSPAWSLLGDLRYRAGPDWQRVVGGLHLEVAP